MAGDSEAPQTGGFTRGRLAFRRWRRTRPFWGGLLLILSGVWILYSANESLGNLQVHLGMAGFQSYVIPLVLILCGGLTLLTPDQRIFYGVIGVAVAIYSLVGANLGGFILGFLLGLFGGALAASWVPVKRKAAVADAAEMPVDAGEEDVKTSQGLDVLDENTEVIEGATAGDDVSVGEDLTTGPLHDTLPTSTRSPLVPTQPSGEDEPSHAYDSSTHHAEGQADEEGEQSDRFPRPRHAANEPEVAGSDVPTDPNETPGLSSRLRKPPGAAIAAIVVLSVAAVALVTFQSPSSAAQETCASPGYQKFLEHAGVTPSTSAKSKSNAAGNTSMTHKTSRSTTGKSSTGSSDVGVSQKPAAMQASTTQSSPGAALQSGSAPISTLVNAVGNLLTGDEPTPSDPPSTAPTETPDPTPSTPEPTPSPTTKPTTTPTTEPTDEPTAEPTKTVKPTLPAPSPSDSAICSVSKTFKAAGLGGVNEHPSKMPTADLVMHNLAYKGIAQLPLEGGGTLAALYFTMDSSTSTPFELQPMVGSHSIDIRSDELTVTGNVQFYCTSISGKLAVAGVGLVPFTFTVDSPPPLVLPEMEFTDVTIQLAYVQSDVLTARALDITTT